MTKRNTAVCKRPNISRLKRPKNSKIKVISLFCGAGGMDVGFHQAGFETCLAIDHWPDAVDTFNHNSKAPVACVRDLANLTPREFLSLIPAGEEPVGIIGGPPCQGFSRGNVGSDPNDPRNLLPFRYASLLSAARKRFNLHFFVFENVTGLLDAKHLPRFHKIVEEFRKAGFRLFVKRLDASNFSVPQKRHRLFIVGLNEDLYPDVDFEFPEDKQKLRVVADVMKGLPSATLFDRTLDRESIPFHPNHWTMVPRSKRFANEASVSASGRSFRRLSWDKPSPTVAYGNREIHVHPDGQRRLTIYEAMLLQGFDPKFEILGSLSSQVTQISNAVPPPLARAIANQLGMLLRSNAKRQPKPQG